MKNHIESTIRLLEQEIADRQQAVAALRSACGLDSAAARPYRLTPEWRARIVEAQRKRWASRSMEAAK